MIYAYSSGDSFYGSELIYEMDCTVWLPSIANTGLGEVEDPSR